MNTILLLALVGAPLLMVLMHRGGHGGSGGHGGGCGHGRSGGHSHGDETPEAEGAPVLGKPGSKRHEPLPDEPATPSEHAHGEPTRRRGC